MFFSIVKAKATRLWHDVCRGISSTVCLCSEMFCNREQMRYNRINLVDDVTMICVHQFQLSFEIGMSCGLWLLDCVYLMCPIN